MQSVWLFVYNNVFEIALFFAYKKLTQGELFFVNKTSSPPPSANFNNSMKIA